jgi:hypothetical protein
MLYPFLHPTTVTLQVRACLYQLPALRNNKRRRFRAALLTALQRGNTHAVRLSSRPSSAIAYTLQLVSSSATHCRIVTRPQRVVRCLRDIARTPRRVLLPPHARGHPPQRHPLHNRRSRRRRQLRLQLGWPRRRSSGSRRRCARRRRRRDGARWRLVSALRR